VVVHLFSDGSQHPAVIGFVVSKAVGNSVVRHRVTRRLRALAHDRVSAWLPGTRLVVRALPPAATASSQALGADLDSCLARLAPSGPTRPAAVTP
jgi:ribonuclease P protein component